MLYYLRWLKRCAKMAPQDIKNVVESFTKRQRIGLRQEFGSIGIHFIHRNDDYVVIHTGPKDKMVQYSFFIRKTGKVVYKKVSFV